MKNVRKILTTTDISEASAAGVGYALELAQREKAELVLLNVADLMEGLPYPSGTETRFKSPEMILKEHEERTRSFLTNHFSDLIKQVDVQVLTDLGVPHQRIVEQAENLGADLIVLSTHGRSGPRRVLLGSVAERVVRHAGCPVLTVRHSAAETA